MLEINGLSAGYRGKEVLKNVSFSVQPHKMTVVLGRNGCGKSTLVSCINQQIADYTGEIRFQDRDLKAMAPAERARAVAILPQALPAPPITVEELVRFGRNPYLSWGRRLSRLDEELIFLAMEQAEVTTFRQSLVSRLSGGERQKAYVAMILAQNTRLIVLDEPTTYMDVEYQGKLMELVLRLKKEQKKTLLVVMHDLSLALRYADNAVVLDGGELRFSGTAEACLASGILEEVFHVKKHVFEEKDRKYVLFDSE